MSSREEWRTVVCAPAYEVSSLGRVRRAGATKCKSVNLNPRTNYFQTTVCVNRKTIVKPIHRLVGEAFLGPRPAGLETRHLNGDRYDNRACNLAYGTHSENMFDQVAHGSHAMARKTHCAKGHAYSEDNTRWVDNKRICKACAREHSTTKNARVRAERIAAGWDPEVYKNRGKNGRSAPYPTECRHGHDLTGANMRLVNGDPTGKWVCRTCEKAAVRRYQARRRGVVIQLPVSTESAA